MVYLKNWVNLKLILGTNISSWQLKRVAELFSAYDLHDTSIFDSITGKYNCEYKDNKMYCSGNVIPFGYKKVSDGNPYEVEPIHYITHQEYDDIEHKPFEKY
jgi:hypothetical protein